MGLLRRAPATATRPPSPGGKVETSTTESSRTSDSSGEDGYTREDELLVGSSLACRREQGVPHVPHPQNGITSIPAETKATGSSFISQLKPSLSLEEECPISTCPVSTPRNRKNAILTAIDEVLSQMDPDFYQLCCSTSSAKPSPPTKTSPGTAASRSATKISPETAAPRSAATARGWRASDDDSGVPDACSLCGTPSGEGLTSMLLPAPSLALDNVCVSCADTSQASHDLTGPEAEADFSIYVPRGEDGREHMCGRGPPPTPSDWAQVGHLTEAEYQIYLQFKEWIFAQPRDMVSTVFHYGADEPMEYGLCRWLRARKFKMDDIKIMIKDATEISADARKDGFYPDAEAALGAPVSVFLSQYPQLYCGHANNGCPIFISKPGALNVQGIECLTTIPGILRYHWHAQMHDFNNRLWERRRANKDFNRFECVVVMDLGGLRAANVNRRSLNIIQMQIKIDSLCFPETMNRTLIINAPGFFSFTWKIIKGYVDARTAAKVEIISSKEKMEKRLKELCNAHELPSDYGGAAEPTSEILMRGGGAERGARRRFNELLSRGSPPFEFKLEGGGEEAEVWIYTKATGGATFTVLGADGDPVAAPVKVRHTGGTGEDDDPSRILIAKSVGGPGKFKVRASGISGSEYFLLIGNVTVAEAKVKSQDVNDLNWDGQRGNAVNGVSGAIADEGLLTLPNNESAEISLDGKVRMVYDASLRE